jgi:manganese/iron transport system ATP-binding protein
MPDLDTADRADDAQPLLRFDNAALSYGDTIAVRGVDGDVPGGQTLALIGPNGAGKSTVLKAVLGLVRVVSGSVTVLGRPPRRARRFVGYVPQADTLDAAFPVTAGQVVLMGRYRQVGWLRRPGRADRDIAAAALAEVGLAERAGDRFGTLSGGQRQRVLLARAIAARPRLLLLDEPFNGVDTASSQALLDALARLRRDGAAVVLSTHDLALAREISDQVCLLDHRQVAFGPTGSTLTPEHLRATYGGRALHLTGDDVVVAF